MICIMGALMSWDIAMMTCWYCICMRPTIIGLTYWGRDKWQRFSRRHLAWIFMNENVWISIKIWLKFVPKGSIYSFPALVQIMVWCRQGDKPLFEAMMVGLLTHICVTWSQWVNIRLTYRNCLRQNLYTRLLFSNLTKSWMFPLAEIWLAYSQP